MPALPHPRPIELLVLMGFLGSGKTTLLSSFLSSPDVSDVAVIVNEIGEIDLDGAILSTVAAKVPMALLSNGCVCCAAGDDVPGTIAMLIEEHAARGRTLARIVLETTGLALPGPLLRSLAPLGAHLKVHVVGTFDLVHGPQALPLVEAAAQWTGAQRLVLTKPDQPSAWPAARARELLAHLNPLAEIVDCADPMQRALAALAPPPAHLRWARDAALALTRDETGQDASPSMHSDIRTYLCRFDDAVAFEDLCVWLDNLAAAAGSRLLRAKGLVHIQGARWPALVQCVGTTFSPIAPAAVPDSPSFLVVIAYRFSLAELREVQPALPIAFRGTARPPSAIGRALGSVLAEARG